MKWSEKAWKAIQPAYDQILVLPFIRELMNGTLDKDKFLFYIQQDALYLSDYGKVLAGIASKLDHSKDREAFLLFATDSISVEGALHESFLRELSRNESVEPSPSCLLYTSYLQRVLYTAPIEVALAAVLPCFWIYKEVGDSILEHQTKKENPYQSWIDTYGGESFEKSVLAAIAICDQQAAKCTEEQQGKMTEAFMLCTKMEWLFWDSAYRQEKWCIE